MNKSYPKIDNLFTRDEKGKLTDLYKRPIFRNIKYWHVTEKVDGTNIRIGLYLDEDGVVSYRVGGRTDKAQVPSGIEDYIKGWYNLALASLSKWMRDHGLESVTLYGEGYGAKIQKGGGRYRKDQAFILFDVRVGNVWLDWENVRNVGRILGLNVVPYLGVFEIENLVPLVRSGFFSCCSQEEKKAEGVIAEPVFGPIYSNNGDRIIFKLKTEDLS